MSSATLVCPACASCFDPATAANVCSACPIGKGCTLACCPSCGWSTPDPGRSRLLRLTRSLARRRPAAAADSGSLAETRAGGRVRIETVDGLPPRRRNQLLAYGIAPGRCVDVVQTEPVTVVRVESTELALERDLAAAIRVVPAETG